VGFILGRSALVGAMLICIALSGCHADTPAEAREKEKERARTAASAAARSFFKQFSKPEPSTEIAWGLREFRRFGPFSWSPDISESPAPPQGTDRVVVSSAGLYTATFNLWCAGIDFDGRPAKRKRTLAIDLRVTGDNASVQGARFVLDEELPGWEQYGGWVVAVLVLSIVAHYWATVFLWLLHQDTNLSGLGGLLAVMMFSVVVALAWYFPVTSPLALACHWRLVKHKVARVIAFFSFPVYVGWVGWLFFASWLAVSVPGVLVLLLGALAWAAVAAAEAREAERKKAEAAEAAKTRMWDDTESIIRQLGKKPWEI
jgi:hypothetical protein